MVATTKALGGSALFGVPDGVALEVDVRVVLGECVTNDGVTDDVGV